MGFYGPAGSFVGIIIPINEAQLNQGLVLTLSQRGMGSGSGWDQDGIGSGMGAGLGDRPDALGPGRDAPGSGRERDRDGSGIGGSSRCHRPGSGHARIGTGPGRARIGGSSRCPRDVPGSGAPPGASIAARAPRRPGQPRVTSRSSAGRPGSSGLVFASLYYLLFLLKVCALVPWHPPDCQSVRPDVPASQRPPRHPSFHPHIPVSTHTSQRPPTHPSFLPASSPRCEVTLPGWTHLRLGTRPLRTSRTKRRGRSSAGR